MTHTLQRIARNCEFAGYGPVALTRDGNLQAQWGDLIHHIEVDPVLMAIWIDGEPVKLAFDPELDPDPVLQATMTILLRLWGDRYKLFPRWKFVRATEGRLVAQSQYLWLDDPNTNEQLFVMEVLVDDVPVYLTTGHIQYGSPNHPGFYKDLLNALQAAKTKGLPDEVLASQATLVKMCAESLRKEAC